METLTGAVMPDIEKVNKWWGKALAKSQQRESHHPKAPKGNRWAVPTRDSSMMPSDGRRREKVMP